MAVKKRKKRKHRSIAIIASVPMFFGINALVKKKKDNYVYNDDPEQKNPLYGKRVIFVENENDEENADGIKGHLETIGNSVNRYSIYDKYFKRLIDVTLSFCGLIILSPIFIGIAFAIKIDDFGPVFFTQKRLGQNKQYFKMHKYRTMKMSTPKDVPTHMLDDPEQYITRVGKFLRLHSLDELPQIWDIFVGNMSIVGPRPALWNQDALIAERDKYGANDVKPGLTGWAQINGRDELEISVKAKLDGEYVRKESLFFDMRCFLATLRKVGHDDSVVEGGTGEIKKAGRHYVDDKSDEERIGHIGFGEYVEIDKSIKRNVLVTGSNSYIGESFCEYVSKNYNANLSVDTIDMIDGAWRQVSFQDYDIVYHVAGIAHADVGNVSEKTKEEYYKINTDLVLEVAKKAKDEGVEQFVFMSSMIVYGDAAPFGKTKIIDKYTVPNPSNFYGDSKFQADVAIRDLADDSFKVIVLRPPMIYGKGSKGNYLILAKLAKKLPFFPKVDNQRSMLYIENFCEFLCQIMLIKKMKENAVVLIPQNSEWINTSDMVEEIAAVSDRKIIKLAIFKPFVLFGSKMHGKIGKLVNKAFGNSCYDQPISVYKGLDYQRVSFRESVARTEGGIGLDKKKKVLFLVNHDVVIYNFRLELVERFISEGYDVAISSPYGERIEDLKILGCDYYEINMDRHGMNPISEMKILMIYRKLISKVEPDVILGYTIKPNIYGAIAAAEKGIPFIANITGLGTAVENSGMSQKIITILYKIAFRKVQKIFFQNAENKQFFAEHKIAVGKYGMLPGSGVNLERFNVKEYPSDTIIRFAFISRIMQEKGIDQYLDTAKVIKEKYPNTEFHVCGFCEKEYVGKLNEYNKEGIVIYHGMIRDVASFLSDIHCVIHPTYYPEGLSNVLLESCASGRPIITTDHTGCKEVVEDGINGFMVSQKDSEKLIDAVERFLHMDNAGRRTMGLNARKKVEREYDRQLVVNAYLEELEKI